MGYRRGREFSKDTKEKCYLRASGRCEVCGVETDLQAHHLLPLWFAREYFPQIAKHALASLANCQILCADCHRESHLSPDFNQYKLLAQSLLGMSAGRFHE